MQTKRHTCLLTQRLMDLACTKTTGSLPVRKRAPPKFETVIQFLRSANGDINQPAHDAVDAAVTEGSEQLTSGAQDVVHDAESVDEFLDELAEGCVLSLFTYNQRMLLQANGDLHRAAYMMHIVEPCINMTACTTIRPCC